MIKIVDVSLNAFLTETKERQIIAVGAGRKLKPFIERHDLCEQICVIVDGDENKIGSEVFFGNKRISVVGYEYLNRLLDPSTVLLITAYIPVDSIIKKLDLIKNIDGINCYIAPLMEEKLVDYSVDYTKGDCIIPKKIHYFWFGHHDIPANLKKCIDSWRRIMPDYEIIRWDESNYDVKKNQYMREAYECKKYGFVPDFARLDVLYQYGGIYLDTDVEVVKSFDDLLCDRSFMGFFDSNTVALGLGFGCVKSNELIGLMRDKYDGISFYDKNGCMNLTTCVEYQYSVLKEYGFSMNNGLQRINGNTVYPIQVFNPEAKMGIHTHYTEDTHSIHRSQVSYEQESVRIAFEQRAVFLKKRIDRQED